MLPVKSNPAADLEIRNTRLFKAPRSLVYKMWTDPEHVVHWYGPKGFTTTNHHMDVRPGGEWRLTLHGPDGTDYFNHKVYEEVVPDERLVMKHVTWPHHQMHVTFADAEGGTRVTVWMVFEEEADFQKVVLEHKAEKGLRENLDRLEEHIANL